MEQEHEEYLPLHLKYRPQTLKGMVGNRATVKALAGVLAKATKPHAYLFTGPSGCGKTTLARIVAKELGCEGMDFQEMNSANYRGIEAMRSLVQHAARRPWHGDAKVYLLDECHQITADGQNALLKLLEEPPRHTYFLLATTDPEKLRPTVRGRCMAFPVEALRRSIVKGHLETVIVKEGEEDVSSAVLSEIARLCSGSMRQALMMLDQVVSLSEGESLEALAEFVGGDHGIKDLCQALLRGHKWAHVQGLLKGLRGDGETTRLSVLGYCDTVMLNDKQENIPCAEILRRFTAPGMAYTTRAGITLACWDVLNARS